MYANYLGTKKLPTRHLQARINSNYVPISRLRIDLNRSCPDCTEATDIFYAQLVKYLIFLVTSTNFSGKTRRGTRSTRTACHNKILYTKI